MQNIVKIPKDLLYDLFRYFLLDETDEYTENAIIDALNAKLDALLKHELYTTYKTAETPDERERARQAYLDKVGMRESFRWSADYKQPEPPEE